MTDTAARLVVVCGLPGVGKTTVARRAATIIDARLIRTDVVRKELVGTPTYDAVEDRRTYDSVLGRARENLGAGRNVVVDGTFRRAADRARARGVARETGSECSLIWVTCDPSVVAERIGERCADASDADFGVHRAVREAWEPLVHPHETVRNRGALRETHRQVDRVLAGSPRRTTTPSTD